MFTREETPIDIRVRLTSIADHLLASARRYASVTGARITPPGAPGGYGVDVDGLEGFARTFLLAAFRLVGDRGDGLDELAQFYARGVSAGVDPESPDRWVRLDEHPQAKVEAASLAVALDMTRPWIWDRLETATRSRVIDYLAPVVGDTTYPRNNWLWFRIVVQTFLRSVGGPWSLDDIRDDLARYDAFVRDGGWVSDGEERSYDHYVGWAMHLYPILWARMHGAAVLAGDRTADDVKRLDAFLGDAVALIGADGSPLIQGRSLIYRFAAAAPLWAGVIADVPSTSHGVLVHAADSIVDHFITHGAADAEGMLSQGWHGSWPALSQSYSGPASPYWAVKGLLGVALPAEHPVWQAVREPLPSQVRDGVRAITAPGWLVVSHASDGIVRVINHGTDHAHPGDLTADSPLYAHIGYSTATSPLLDEQAWTHPQEQAVVLLSHDGDASHRTGMELLGVRVDDTGGHAVGVAASRAQAHWVTPGENPQRHGSGLHGTALNAGELVVQSIVRGAWEVRVVDVLSLSDEVRTLQIGGWAVSADRVDTSTSGEVTSTRLSSRIVALSSGATLGTELRTQASPLGAASGIPFLTVPAAVGQRVLVALELTLTSQSVGPAPVVDDQGRNIAITWPDGVRTLTRLFDSASSRDDVAPLSR